MLNSNADGIECPHCHVWNLHSECGTYEVLVLTCKAGDECTEVEPDIED